MEWTMTDDVERRRSPRTALEADVQFRRSREAHYGIKMHDMSPEGCKIASPERLDRGEMVWVQLPSLESMSGHVKWSRAWQSGVEFERPMHVAVFDMMAGRLAPEEA
jgi:hypothetical protein